MGVVGGRGHIHGDLANHVAGRKLFVGKNCRKLAKVKHFANKTFAACLPHALPVPPTQEFVNKSFAERGNTVTFANVFTCKSFRLYTENTPVSKLKSLLHLQLLACTEKAFL